MWHYFLSYDVFKDWCIFYTYSTSQFGLATFCVFIATSDLWIPFLDSTALEIEFEIGLMTGKYRKASFY